jgi:hypothetical protein
MAQQRWPMAEDPRLFTDFTLAWLELRRLPQILLRVGLG